MSNENIPPHFVLDKSKEVIFYLRKGSVEKENELSAWMQKFPSDYKGMVIKSACLFKKLKEDSRK
tara:strand:+ start:1901 stop:2095 length:195 start_codon:yes stop_codon:yes gene_type:complete